MTVRELAEMIQMHPIAVKSSIREAREKYGTKYFLIVGYAPYRGRGGPPAPIYGPGSETDRDAVKPESSRKETRRRYHHKHKALINTKKRIKRGTMSLDALVWRI